MEMAIVLSLSLSANVMLIAALLKSKRKLMRATHSLIEVGAGRAEVIDLGDRIAVRHKLITNEDNVTL
jgi:hypothetical protein